MSLSPSDSVDGGQDVENKLPFVLNNNNLSLLSSRKSTKLTSKGSFRLLSRDSSFREAKDRFFRRGGSEKRLSKKADAAKENSFLRNTGKTSSKKNKHEVQPIPETFRVLPDEGDLVGASSGMNECPLNPPRIVTDNLTSSSSASSSKDELNKGGDNGSKKPHLISLSVSSHNSSSSNKFSGGNSLEIEEINSNKLSACSRSISNPKSSIDSNQDEDYAKKYLQHMVAKISASKSVSIESYEIRRKLSGESVDNVSDILGSEYRFSDVDADNLSRNVAFDEHSEHTTNASSRDDIQDELSKIVEEDFRSSEGDNITQVDAFNANITDVDCNATITDGINPDEEFNTESIAPVSEFNVNITDGITPDGDFNVCEFDPGITEAGDLPPSMVANSNSNVSNNHVNLSASHDSLSQKFDKNISISEA